MKKQSAGFAIDIDPQHVIEANVEDTFASKHGNATATERAAALRAGVIDAKSRLTEKGWDWLNDDIGRIEHNVLALLRKKFDSVRDEGHVDDALVGTVWFDRGKRAQVALVDKMIDGMDLEDLGDVHEGLSELGNVLSGRLHAFDIEDA